MWTVIKPNVSKGVYIAHLSQTAHSEETAHQKYLSKNGTRGERVKVLEIYLECLLCGQEDDFGLNKKVPAPAVIEVESDFQDDPPSPRPERPPHQLHRCHTHPQLPGSPP